MDRKRKFAAVLTAAIMIVTLVYTGTASADQEQYTAGSSMPQSGMSVRSFTSETTPKIPSKYNTGYIQEKGIDVSQWQGDITQAEWNNIKESGCDFAIVRAGYRSSGSSGKLHIDPYFTRNVRRAYRAGLNVGVYFFSQALSTSEAKAEADYMITLLNNNKLRSYITLPMFMDYEYTSGRFRSGRISKSRATSNAAAFMKYIKAKGGTPGFYANMYFLNNQVYAGTVDNYGKIWLANYTSGGSVSSYSGAYHYWQWTSEGSVSGISGNVDMDAGYVCGLRHAARSTNSITVKWTAAPGASSYRVYVYDRYNCGTYLKYVNTNSTSCVVSGLQGGREYFFKIRANYSNPYNTKKNLSSGYVTSYTGLRYTKKAVVNVEKIYLKKQPVQSSGSGLLVRKETKLDVIAMVYDRSMNPWYHVSYTTGGKTYTGYIRPVYVNTLCYGKTKTSVTIRSGAGTSYDAVKTIAKGKTLRIHKTINGWYYVAVTTGGVTYKGYVPVSSLTTL
ncbi:MAG: GH25 family lysozyme [Anaerovoracaceae bacterium]|nr:GH25 family lysozyme [Anaerovoracaceae bacterium]